MKTLILAAIRCSLIFTAVAALSLAYPAAVQAVPTTYQVHRQPLHRRERPLHHERLRVGNGDVGGPLPPNFQVHRHAHGIYIFRWRADNHGSHCHYSCRSCSRPGPQASYIKWHIDLERDIGDNHQAVGTVNDLASSGLIADFAIQQVAGTIVGEGQNMLASRRLGDPVSGSGHGVYPLNADADPYGVGCSGPAVQAGSGLTAPGLAEVASWRSATRPASRFQQRSQFFICVRNETLSVVAMRVNERKYLDICYTLT